MWWPVIAVAVVAGCSSTKEPSADAAQQSRRPEMDSLSACRDCEFALEPIAILGSIDDPVLPNQEAHVARLTNGEFRLLGPDRASIVRYDATGRYVGEGGSAGDGPGELNDVAELGVGPGDSLLARRRDNLIAVMDAMARPVRSFRLPAGCLLDLVEGRFPCLINPGPRAKLEWRDLDGSRSGDSHSLSTSGDDRIPGRRFGIGVAAGLPRTIIAIRAEGHLFERVTFPPEPGGDATLHPSSGFESSPEQINRGGQMRGQPLLLGDGSGFIYVIRNIDTVTNRPVPTGPVLVRTERGLAPEFAAAMEARDSGTIAIVEVFDRDGKWLLERTHGGTHLRAGGGGILFQMRSDTNDVLQAHIFVPRVRRDG